MFSNIIGNDSTPFIGEHIDEDKEEETTTAQVDILFDGLFRFYQIYV